MEEYVPRILMVTLCVMLMFIFPMSTAYERQDDISYAYASKAVHMFVDNVRNKGYISPSMYQDFLNTISVTNNDYEINLERKKKTYYPIIEVYSYDKAKGKMTFISETTDIDTFEKDQFIVVDGTAYKEFYYKKGTSISSSMVTKAQKADLIKNMNAKEEDFLRTIVTNAKAQYEVIKTPQILATLYPKDLGNLSTIDSVISAVGDSRRYVRFAKDDIFTVVIKNRNVTISTMLTYSFVSDNIKNNMSKIYINYGGEIRNENWYKICPSCSYKEVTDTFKCSNCNYHWSKLCTNCYTLNSTNNINCIECNSTSFN